MKSLSEKLWLRKHATDDEASSDISSRRQGSIFTDSELGESLEDEAARTSASPVEQDQTEMEMKNVDEKQPTVCTCGMYWNHDGGYPECWTGTSKVLVSDRRMFRRPKRKTKPRMMKRRIRKVTVGVQTSPADFEDTPDAIPPTRPSDPSLILNPLETSVPSNGVISESLQKMNIESFQEKMIKSQSCLNPFAKPYSPQLP